MLKITDFDNHSLREKKKKMKFIKKFKIEIQIQSLYTFSISVK